MFKILRGTLVVGNPEASIRGLIGLSSWHANIFPRKIQIYLTLGVFSLSVLCRVFIELLSWVGAPMTDSRGSKISVRQ